MSSLNKCQIIGNVGKDPEVRSFPNGGRVANFSVATAERWKDKTTGEQKEKTEWHRISVTNENLVSIVERFVKKGTKVYLEGQLQTRKWTDSNGVEKYSTEIVLKPFNGQIVLLSSKEQNDAPDDEPEQVANPVASPQANTDMDSEIPF